MLWFLSLMVIDVTLVQSFYGTVPARVVSSASNSFQKSLSSSSQSRYRIKSLREPKVYGSKTRAYATSTDIAKGLAVETSKTIAVESCNWPTPVPYSQLTVGVPKETSEGESKKVFCTVNHCETTL